jgi:Bifunctional DNA primase/polymerase, N-terminal/Primase C terminal 1 (PriCT-1)
MRVNERAARFSEYARLYAGSGWTLLKLNGKVPPASSWQKTRYADPDNAAGKWSHWGQTSNMGVLLGASRLNVAEPDTPDAYEILVHLCGGELPATPTVRSGGKSVHMYFVDAGRGAAARDGLELRAGNQQCVLPPSIHPVTERPYEWVDGRAPWQVELAPVPERLLDYAERAGTTASAIGGEIREPGRHRGLLSLAGTMRRRGMELDEILAALRAVNEGRCKPPLPDAEVVALAGDVVRRYEPATDPEQEKLRAEASRILAGADVVSVKVDARRRRAPELIVRLVEFLGGEENEAAWIVDHLAARGALVIIAGLPKVGKSTFVYGMLGTLTGSDDE